METYIILGLITMVLDLFVMAKHDQEFSAIGCIISLVFWPMALAFIIFHCLSEI
jgi:hypothetical protein